MSLRRLRAEIGRHLASGLALVVLLFAIAWVIAHALGPGGNVPQFIIVALNGLSLAGLYFIVASGFTLIFGLMRVVNMAHGSFYLLGGYIALKLQRHFVGGGGSFGLQSSQ